MKAKEQVKFNRSQCTSHKTNRIISEHNVTNITMPVIFCSWNVFLLCSVKFPCERQIKVAPLNWYSTLICQWGLCSPSFGLERITHMKPGGQVTWIRHLIVLRDFHARQRSIYYPRKQLFGLMTFGGFPLSIRVHFWNIYLKQATTTASINILVFHGHTTSHVTPYTYHKNSAICLYEAPLSMALCCTVHWLETLHSTIDNLKTYG